MPATVNDLRGLHDLHRRAKAIRDRLESGPKTLAARQRGLEKRRQALEEAREALKHRKADVHRQEMQVQSQRTRVDDLRVKLNAVKKNEEYKAIMSEIAMINNTIAHQEDAILELMQGVETSAAELAAQEAEAARFAGEVEALRVDVETKAEGQRAQLKELEGAIAESESVVPEEDRERYRRTVRGQGDDAFAGVDSHTRACDGCNQVITIQAVSELMNAEHLVYCKTCGRIMYLVED
ncbi:zinc ribbon domain-containing protein [Tautonia plasticadhaerens]|uniref:Zinc ribbon domain protein n=1 Tax=Tautonia plasticadhaerens TaxID=2527974 RepID=A0A518GW93_9BACT|nr:C4-type zinc ribbon domain-containing protein [Tautonia plasticadhaerens]QDV32870.1 Putative zinc ribbon domain protein [Tautonia plasticadhaerens]